MVSTRQSSNSGTNTEVSSLGEFNKIYETGHLVSSKKSHHQSGLSASTPLSTEVSSSLINLLDLPVEVLQKILCYLDYNTVAHLRPVRIYY